MLSIVALVVGITLWVVAVALVTIKFHCEEWNKK